jgi:3-hydroxyisobutyrate dehydrogenase-like beta-hydroxyacid dehydrogenase
MPHERATRGVTTVGVLGTGRMGSSMARALASAGYEVVLWNRTPEAAAALATELGGRTADRPAAVAEAADVCITMLADGDAVDEVVAGPDGLVAGAGPRNVLVDASTVPPDVIRGLEDRVRATGAGILDSPVSGSVALATSGKLTLMVGGSTGDLEQARPVLESLSATIFHLGPLGTGAAMKLAVNTVIFGLNQAVAEGLVLAEAAGIPRDVAYDILTVSAVGAPYVGYKRAAFLDPEGTPVGMSLALAEKDLRLITAFGEATGTALPQAATNLDQVRAAERTVGDGADMSAVASHLRKEGRG